MRKAVFLDRDGVINQKAPTEDEYVTRWEQVDILPGVAEAVARLNGAGFHIYVVTNQRSVAKGLITATELEVIHVQLCRSLAEAGARVDGIYYCPHDLEPPCDCRKPQPGMLFEAARSHDIDLTISWMIGDSEKDVEAGKRAGCRTVKLVPNGKSSNNGADIIAPSLLSAVKKILELTADSGNLFEFANRS
jgi:D-glycero-D-manno-heptose 1,7-bisphosphate phosphatase